MGWHIEMQFWRGIQALVCQCYGICESAEGNIQMYRMMRYKIASETLTHFGLRIWRNYTIHTKPWGWGKLMSTPRFLWGAFIKLFIIMPLTCFPSWNNDIAPQDVVWKKHLSHVTSQKAVVILSRHAQPLHMSWYLALLEYVQKLKLASLVIQSFLHLAMEWRPTTLEDHPTSNPGNRVCQQSVFTSSLVSTSWCSLCSASKQDRDHTADHEIAQELGPLTRTQARR